MSGDGHSPGGPTAARSSSLASGAPAGSAPPAARESRQPIQQRRGVRATEDDTARAARGRDPRVAARPAELHLDLGGIHRAAGALLITGVAEALVGATGLALIAATGVHSVAALAILAVAAVTGCGLAVFAVVSGRPAARARRHASVVGATGILLAYRGTYVAVSWDAVEQITVHRPGGRSRAAVVVARLAAGSAAGNEPVLGPFRFPEQARSLGLPDDDRTVFVGVLSRGPAGETELRLLRGLAGPRLADDHDDHDDQQT